MKARQIAFRADASVCIGTGHVMRCLNLAGALSAKGAECHFICRKFDGNLLEEIRSRGFAIYGLPKCLHDGASGRTGRQATAADMCASIAAGLDLRGSMNVQLRLTDKGPRVFEINPRFSSTVLMRHRLGYCDVLWAMDEVEGRAVTYPEIAIDKIMVRVQTAAIFDGTQDGVSQ